MGIVECCWSATEVMIQPESLHINNHQYRHLPYQWRDALLTQYDDSVWPGFLIESLTVLSEGQYHPLISESRVNLR